MLEFLILGIALIISLVFVAFLVYLNHIFSPKTKKSELKLTSYECGEELLGEAHIRMSLQYYTYGIAYLITDILAIFVIIWAFHSINLGIFGLFSIIFFSFLILFGLGYVIKKKLLRWL